MRRIRGLLLGRLPNDHLGINTRRSARPWSILLQAGDAELQETLSPSRHRLSADLKCHGDFNILLALRGQQHNFCPLHKSLGDASPARIRIQFYPLFFSQ
jgi:hypothetical protein